MTDPTTDYLASLAQLANDRDQPLREEAEPPLTPLHTRLQRLISSLPTEERHKPRALAFYAERLKGRQGGTPLRGELGAALRSLGHTRRRQWRTTENGFRALWYPPKEI